MTRFIEGEAASGNSEVDCCGGGDEENCRGCALCGFCVPARCARLYCFLKREARLLYEAWRWWCAVHRVLQP